MTSEPPTWVDAYTQKRWASDGDAVITRPIKLKRDMYYDNLIIFKGGSIDTNGHKLFAECIDWSRDEEFKNILHAIIYTLTHALTRLRRSFSR